MTKLNSKQKGDAAEMLVAGMIGVMGGWPVTKMPDNWPVYDLLAHTDDSEKKIQVTTVRLKLEQEQLARVVGWFDLGTIGLEGR